ncbi:MAG TPA: hypothetical protein VIF37_14625 [Methylobacter sp.]
MNVVLRCRSRDGYLNRGLAPEGELLSFASPRQLLLRCSTSCIHAVEKKVTKENAARLALESLGTSLCLALRVRCMQIGHPADLSRQKLRCSARQTGLNPYHWQVSITT